MRLDVAVEQLAHAEVAEAVDELRQEGGRLGLVRRRVAASRHTALPAAADEGSEVGVRRVHPQEYVARRGGDRMQGHDIRVRDGMQDAHLGGEERVEGRGRSVEGQWKVSGRSVEGEWKVSGR